MRHLMRDHRLELIARKGCQEPFGHGNTRRGGVVAGRERVGIGVRDDPDSGLGQSRGDGHFLHHVHQLFLLRGARLDQLPGTGGP